MTTAKKKTAAGQVATTGSTEITTPAAPLNIIQDDIVTIKRGNRPMTARIAAVGEDNVSVILKSAKMIENLPRTSVLEVVATGTAAAETEGFRQKTKPVAKTDRAVAILLAENANGGRRHVMNIFMKELGMEDSTANTYYYLAKAKAEKDGHTIPAFVKAVEEAAAPVAATESDAATA